ARGRRARWVPSRFHSDPYSAEARRRRGVAGVALLVGLALAAVRRPPRGPFAGVAEAVERTPELRGDAGVGRVAQHAAARAVLDLPRDLRAELEVEPLVVDGPRPVRRHVD